MALLNFYLKITVALVACTVFTACHRSPVRRGELAAAEKKLALQSQKVFSQNGRTPTSETTPVCFADRFATVESIRREITTLENAVTGPPLTGVVLGMDLSRMPRAQASYIVSFERWMQTDQIDYSSCTDLLCALGRLYPATDPKSPLLHYLFYLKTNYAVSAKMDVPGMEVRSLNLPLSSVLFSSDELKQMLQLLYSLPSRYLNMPLLASVHRVPRRYHVPGSDACGLASPSVASSGHIEMMDPCLELHSENRGFLPANLSSTLYFYLSHELSHVLDQVWGFPAGTRFTGNRFSEANEWKTFSGWAIREVTNPGSQAVARQWASNPSLDGFPRPYAGSQPVEDFADSVAYTRFEPALMLRVAPRKYAFLSERVFDGRKFNVDGLSTFYVAETIRRLQAQLPEVIQRCVATPEANVPPQYTPRYRFSFLVQPGVLVCLESSIDQRLSEITNQLRFEELEACSFFGEQQVNFQRAVQIELEPTLASLLIQNQNLGPQLRAAENLRNQLEVQVEPREVLLGCWSQAALQTCYDAALAQAFDAVAAPLTNDLGPLLTPERQRFLAAHSYDNARTGTLALFRNLLAGIEPSIVQDANEKWSHCRQEQAPPSALLVTPYSGGTHYIAAPILSCINLEATRNADELLSRWLRRFGLNISGEQARTLMREEVQVRYLATIDAAVQRESAQELNYRNARFLVLGPPMVTSLIRSRDWTTGAAEEVAMRSQCQTRAGQLIEAALAAEPAPDARTPSLKQLRFISVQDLTTQWKQEVCNQVMVSADVVRQLRANAVAQWTASLGNLESIFENKVTAAIGQCRNLYPGAGSQNARRRADCVTIPDNWNIISTAAMTDWLQTVDGQRFASRRNEAQAYIDSHRSEWQGRALRRMEGGAR